MNARNGANRRAYDSEDLFFMAVIHWRRLDKPPMDEPAPLKFASGQFWVSVPRRRKCRGYIYVILNRIIELGALARRGGDRSFRRRRQSRMLDAYFSERLVIR